MSDWKDQVRVRYDKPSDVTYLQHAERSEAQKAQDEILDKATEHAEAALEHVNTALDWLSVVTPPKHRTVPVYVQQLVEEIAELRRVRG